MKHTGKPVETAKEHEFNELTKELESKMNPQYEEKGIHSIVLMAREQENDKGFQVMGLFNAKRGEMGVMFEYIAVNQPDVFDAIVEAVKGAMVIAMLRR